MLVLRTKQPEKKTFIPKGKNVLEVFPETDKHAGCRPGFSWPLDPTTLLSLALDPGQVTPASSSVKWGKNSVSFGGVGELIHSVFAVARPADPC